MEGSQIGNYRDELLIDALKHLHLSINVLIDLNVRLMAKIAEPGFDENKQFAQAMQYLGNVSAGVEAFERAAGGPPQTLFLAVETTGNVIRVDEVLDIAVIDDAGKILFNELVKPSRLNDWPKFQSFHGIMPAAVATANPLSLLLPRLFSLCSANTLIIFNALFDLAWLPGLYDVAKEVHCCMRATAGAESKIDNTELLTKPPAWKRQRLANCAEFMNYPWQKGKPKRALDIARACRFFWSCLDDVKMEGSR